LPAAFASVQRGIPIDFGGQNAVVAADLRIAFQETLHLEKLYGFGICNIVEDEEPSRLVTHPSERHDHIAINGKALRGASK
jgi:hypothetical protein